MYIGYQNIDNEIAVVNGDFAKGDVSQEQIPDILALNQGHIRQLPLAGCNFVKYINSPNSVTNRLKLQRIVRLQLIAAKYTVSLVKIANINNVEIDAIK